MSITGANDQVLNPHFTELFELGTSELNFKQSRFTVTPPHFTPPHVCLLARVTIKSTGCKLQTKYGATIGHNYLGLH